jgi:acetyltransferase
MSLLAPSSVAVIGASSDEKKVGHLVLRNLLTQGYEGHVYPVNPKGGEILGKTAYTSVGAITAAVDLAVIATPAETVESLLEECGKKGILSVVVVSSGFSETGTEGRNREEALRQIAKRYGMNLVGPNCLGLMRPGLKMNASFAPRLPPAGNVALLSQSGALGDAFVDQAECIGLKLSLFLSMGNKAVMDECDFLRLCADDPETKVIGFYLENIRDGAKFLELAREVCREKPVVLLKSGTTEGGRKAVSSHTGALAGSDAAVDAICAQSGVRRAANAEDFLNLLRTLSLGSRLLSPNIAVITNAGGPGVLAADAAQREGLVLPSLSPEHETALRQLLPPSASVRNPIDVLGDALADRYEHALKAVARDPGIDGAVVLLTPQAMTPATEIAEGLAKVRKLYPLFPVVACFMGEKDVREAITILHRNGIPNVSYPETAIRMLAFLRKKGVEKKTRVPRLNDERAAKAAAIIGDGTGLLSEEKTAELFALYELPTPRGTVATTADEAAAFAKEIGYPVAAKVSSKDILHKTDIGGVRVNLQTEEDVRAAFQDILRNAKERAPDARVGGVLIQQSLPPGNEFIIGAIREESVGHLVMAGLGGIYTELFKDVSFRVAPFSAPEASTMLASLRSWKLLMGMRGAAPLDVSALSALISTVSLLVRECPKISELDLNPILISEKTLTILDAKVIVGERE